VKLNNLSRHDIEAIIQGTHSDPFSYLGYHRLNEAEVVIRVFQPIARQVELITDHGHLAMSQLHAEGLFEFIGAYDDTNPYEIYADIENGTVVRRFDSYAFPPLLSEYDLYLWGEGRHFNAWKFMGAHHKTVGNISGTHFVVCAPSASVVSVVGSFNFWDPRMHMMRKIHDQGLWEIFIPGVFSGESYKFHLQTPYDPSPLLKSDPYAVETELRPKTASIVSKPSTYVWMDQEWIEKRGATTLRNQPLSIYELHLGSWRRTDSNNFIDYRTLADELIPYVQYLGYTHVEFMPLAEHPYDPSWGYQITGYFAPTSRFGKPDDLRYLIDRCHQANIGVIMDWVPAHFARDDHGLYRFDGTHLYEHADPRKGEHNDWGTLIFNYGRSEVVNFLISNALYWIEEFHIDGIRVDAVASMLYLDYSKKEGEWIPNQHGGRENLEAIAFIRLFNEKVHECFPGVITFAEESTSWPMVTQPTYAGGLGFDFKWNMGWMNDVLEYIQLDPIHRKYHHNKLTFSLVYAFSESYILPFSHDEVVHLKKSMLTKMPGDDWQRFANLRLLYGYMYGHPGKKLLFMGSEFGQWDEWNVNKSIDWHLTYYDRHHAIMDYVSSLNKLYRTHPALFEVDADWKGFQWINHDDADQSVLSFIRYAEDKKTYVVMVFNFTPVIREHYKIGVPENRAFTAILNSDELSYGGSGVDVGQIQILSEAYNGFPATMTLKVPPLSAVYFVSNNSSNFENPLIE
jgi:1,4-alpha-glucan branching enzyme